MSRVPASFAERLLAARRVLVTAHRSPDGDAVGSSLAAGLMLRATGREAVVWIPGGVPRPYRFLPGAGSVTTGKDPGGRFDATLVLDTSDPDLLEVPLPPADVRGPVLVLDHHLSGKGWGDVVVCERVAAAGQLVWDLAGLLGFDPDADFATCVYTALVTDTGMFRYDLTTPETHGLAARCLELGVQPWVVARHVWEEYPESYLRLWSDLLATLEVDMDGRLATLTVTEGLLARHGAPEDALEDAVNWPRGIAGVEVAALIRRRRDGKVRVSLRSNGRVSVAEIARRIGGGGHFAAAGCSLPEGTTFEEARRRVAAEVADLLGR